MKLSIILLITCFHTLINTKFEVYMPTCATSMITSQIKYTLANFGHILYGRTIVGELFVLDNEKFCDVDGVDNINSYDDDVKEFILIKRGGCKFTKKILNAQLKGAKMAIIYDNDTSSAPDVIMANDGHGHLIDIPSIFISNADGKNLIQAVQKCKSAILKMRFQVYQSKKANLTLWLNANNRQSFIMVKDFYADYYSVIKKYLNLQLRFKVNSNCGHQTCQEDDCLSDKKKYCLSTKKQISGKHLPGKQIINEHLRQYFMYQQTKDYKSEAWWKYMTKFDNNLCAQVLDIKACSEKIMKQLKFDPAVINRKIADTYNNLTKGQKDNVLEKFVGEAYRGDILFYPQATINGRNFYGLFRAPDIFQMICESLTDPPKQCYSFIKNDRKQTFGEDQTEGLWKTILFILSMMVVAFLFALFVYTKLIRREINQQISVQANKIVQHYVQLSEEKSKSNARL